MFLIELFKYVGIDLSGQIGVAVKSRWRRS